MRRRRSQFDPEQPVGLPLFSRIKKPSDALFEAAVILVRGQIPSSIACRKPAIDLTCHKKLSPQRSEVGKHQYGVLYGLG